MTWRSDLRATVHYYGLSRPLGFSWAGNNTGKVFRVLESILAGSVAALGDKRKRILLAD